MKDSAPIPRGLTPSRYHAQSRHAFERYAPGPATLDWEQQPCPNRVYEGAAAVPLALGEPLPDLPFADLTWRGALAPAPLGLPSLGTLLRLALGISAWKRLGEARWAVRCNPSSGNLHPVECYAVQSGLPGLAAGLYHYECESHALERRCVYDTALAGALGKALPPGGLLLGLSLVPWREEWKYGLRAWRYCQLDLGHAIAALDYAAACLGWRLRPVPGWDRVALARLLGLDRMQDFHPDEPEYPQALLLARPAHGAVASTGIDPALFADLEGQAWSGRANRLDPRHLYRWPDVDAMAQASGPIEPRPSTPPDRPSPLPAPPQVGAAPVILNRRSARGFDPRLAMDSGALYRILDACLERPGSPPWGALGRVPGIWMLIFVHRVRGLDPGLYLFAPSLDSVPGIKARLRGDLEWGRNPDCPPHLPFYRLVRANARSVAGRLACHQRIASDSSLALAMLGDLPADAPQSQYDGLLREAGALGQVLYLEAEASGLGASGIGCFFDEPIRELLGLSDDALQTFYMFTLGPALGDPGATDEPAYPEPRG